MAPTEPCSITLPAERASIKRARDFVERAVAGHVNDPSDVLLMTSELVSNVVGHVGSVLTVTVRNGPVVRIEVHNHDAATEAFRDLLDHSSLPSTTSPTGRGLAIVRSLASRIGLDDDPGKGKVVWFEWEHPDRERFDIAPTETGWKVSGEIDANVVPRLVEAFSVLPLSVGPIAIDMSAVSFIDSSGLRELIALAGRAGDAGRSVNLERPSSSVVRLIEITGLAEMFGTQPDR
jgi:anti-sigma B factor antagonist